ncbi:MAG: rhodanese-like domain-containing protein [Zoogloeaceae bacterium]|jgi:rhodanese-related sulfurtransferase|nr:rhodanese-like domain-containing protein [Zoogloeaceae bacterium]
MEFVRNNILLVSIAIISGIMLVWPGFRQGGKRLSTHQATQLINREEAVIIDVRDAAEYAAGHLPESRNIPLQELDSPAHAEELEKLKERALLLVCASGIRSGQACSRLEKRGFQKLNHLDGGVDAWQRAGLPLTRSKKK